LLQAGKPEIKLLFDMTITDWKDFFTIIGVIITAIGVIWAVYVYRRNSKLERVKWIANLYEKFYEKDDLKVIREILDCQVSEDGQSNARKKSRLDCRRNLSCWIYEYNQDLSNMPIIESGNYPTLQAA